MSRTLTKADLVDRVQQATGLARAECVNAVEDLLEEMKLVLAQGEELKLTGLGTFVVRVKGARRGRNPATATDLLLARRRVVTFRPSLVLRQAMNRDET